MLRTLLLLLALVFTPLTAQATHPAPVVEDFEQLDLSALLSSRPIDWLHDFAALDLQHLLRSDRREARDFSQLDLQALLAG